MNIFLAVGDYINNVIKVVFGDPKEARYDKKEKKIKTAEFYCSITLKRV